MAVGLLIRLLLAGTTSWNYDIHVWYQFASDLKTGIGIYTNRTFSYPPGAALILVIIYLPLILFSGPDQWGRYSGVVDKLGAKSLLFTPIINSPFFGYYTKIPIFAAEIALLYVLYLTYKNTIPIHKMKLLALVFYLSPLIIFINAVHAQLDIYVVLALAIAVLFYKKEQFLWAGLALGFATSIKLYPGFLFLAYLFLIIVQTSGKQLRIRRVLKFSLSFALPIILMFLFMIRQPAAMISTFARVNTIGFEGSLNLGFINYIPPLVPLITKNSVILTKFMEYCLLVLPFFGIWLTHFSLKKLPNLKPYLLEYVSAVVLLLTFLFSSRTNPNYLIWVMPFLLALAAFYVVSIRNIISISMAALLFYFGINSLSWKVLLMPLTYFGYQVQPIADQYYHFSASSGLINLYIYADVFLIAAVWFLAIIFVIIYRATRFQETLRSQQNDYFVDNSIVDRYRFTLNSKQFK